jgi:aminopeptidase N
MIVLLSLDRVTCRDWFQLSLKEGLTVFRDHGENLCCSSYPFSYQFTDLYDFFFFSFFLLF